MKRRRSIFRIIIAPIIVTLAMVPTIAIAVREVLHGRAAATYLNVYGLSIHYTSILILVLALVLALAAAYIARIIYFWRIAHVGTTKLRKVDSLRTSADSGGGK
jgi:uncharacterized membrane protein